MKHSDHFGLVLQGNVVYDVSELFSRKPRTSSHKTPYMPGFRLDPLGELTEWERNRWPSPETLPSVLSMDSMSASADGRTTTGTVTTDLDQAGRAPPARVDRGRARLLRPGVARVRRYAHVGSSAGDTVRQRVPEISSDRLEGSRSATVGPKRIRMCPEKVSCSAARDFLTVPVSLLPLGSSSLGRSPLKPSHDVVAWVVSPTRQRGLRPSPSLTRRANRPGPLREPDFRSNLIGFGVS